MHNWTPRPSPAPNEKNGNPHLQKDMPQKKCMCKRKHAAWNLERKTADNPYMYTEDQLATRKRMLKEMEALYP
jgi:hypothetical protein